MRHLREPQLVVEHMNGPDVPPVYRLLVTLTGRVEPSYRPFSGKDWAPQGTSGFEFIVEWTRGGGTQLITSEPPAPRIAP